MKKSSKIIAKVGAVASSVWSSLYFASATMAATTTNASEFIPQGVGTGGDLMTFAKEALNLAISLAALVAVGILVYSGVQYIIASGDEAKIEKATKGITYAVIGLVICFISVLVVNFVLTRLLGQG